MLKGVQALRRRLPEGGADRVAVELNTSCPNIPGAPPAGYEPEALLPALEVLAGAACMSPSGEQRPARSRSAAC